MENMKILMKYVLQTAFVLLVIWSMVMVFFITMRLVNASIEVPLRWLGIFGA